MNKIAFAFLLFAISTIALSQISPRLTYRLNQGNNYFMREGFKNDPHYKSFGMNKKENFYLMGTAMFKPDWINIQFKKSPVETYKILSINISEMTVDNSGSMREWKYTCDDPVFKRGVLYWTSDMFYFFLYTDKEILFFSGKRL